MSLYDTIRRATAVGVKVGIGTGGAGVPCRVRQQEALNDQADNSGSFHWAKVPGLPSTVPVLLSPMSENTRRYGWGDQTDANVGGTAALEYGLTVGMILKPTVGSFAGRFLKVIAAKPSDLGNLTEMALQDVPEELDFGF